MDRQAGSEGSKFPSPSRAPLSRFASLLLAGLLLTSCSGCQIVIGVMQIFQGFPKTHSDFWVRTHHRSLGEKGKRVLVLAYAPARAQSEEPSLDLDVMAEVARRLKVEKIDVVEPHKVGRWIDEKGQITPATDLEPIAKEFDADFVVLFCFDDFGYLEDNSPGLYRGHASGKVVVTEIVGDKSRATKKRAKVIYNNPFTSKFPANQPKLAEQEGPEVFKRRFKARLAAQLTRTFVDYRPEDEIE